MLRILRPLVKFKQAPKQSAPSLSTSAHSSSIKVSAHLMTAGVAAGAGALGVHLWHSQKPKPSDKKDKLTTSPVGLFKNTDAYKRPNPKVFPSSIDPIPAGYEGRVFELSQDYPSKLPYDSKLTFLECDFVTDPMRYMALLRDYVYRENLESDWRPENNKESTWVHTPWMHTGNNPREFVRGLTRERDSLPGELGELQKTTIQNWGVGLYNGIGGYTIGNVWKDPNDPNPKVAKFENGAVVVKILFSEATINQVPELEGAFEWTANINTTIDKNSPKAIRPVRLLQMDVAVRDPRADKLTGTGWVFGTFVYDKTAPGKTPWEKMVPVGLMWGNDPGITPDDVKEGAKLKESIISPTVPAYAKKRLGWAGRLNGPVDNFISSCLSCHSTAQWKPTASLTFSANASRDEKLRWFRNIKPTQPFDEGQIPLDYSLQLEISLQNFYASKGEEPKIRATLK